MRRLDAYFSSLRPRTVLASALLLALCLCSPTASADDKDPGQDEVTLKSGGSIRGTVIVSEPGKSVEISVLGESQTRTVPWAEVDRVQKGKYAVAPGAAPSLAAGLAPPPPFALAAPPAPRLGDPGVVRVHIESPAPVRLVYTHYVSYPVTESRVDSLGNTVFRDAVATKQQRDTLCSSPCDTLVSQRDLRIVGDGFPSSRSFDFKDSTGDVTVHVRPGSSWAYGSGIAGIVLGSAATLAGPLVIAFNQADSTTTDRNTGVKVNVPDPALRGAGIGLIAGGVALLGAGIALVVTGRTKLSFDPPSSTATVVKPRYWMGEF